MKGFHDCSLAFLYLYSPTRSIQTLLAGCAWCGISVPQAPQSRLSEEFQCHNPGLVRNFSATAPAPRLGEEPQSR